MPPSASVPATSLSKFVAECSLPGVVQVLAGCYANISPNKDNELYVHSTSRQTVVVAESLARKTITARSGRRPRSSSSGHTLTLPLDYDGWFELMSVDGRTAPVMSSVRQLVEVFPARCLVRKTINAMSTDDVCRGSGTRSMRVARGEVLTLMNVTGQQLLQCRDERGSDVYLPVNQRGLFSAISGHTAANVYSLRSLLAEFRLPIVVRLVSGALSLRELATSGGELRLVGIQTDRVTFILPLRHAWASKVVDRRALVAVPSKHASRLTVAAAAKDFYYHWAMSDDGLELLRRCNDIVASWKVSVHVVSSAVAAAAAASATSRSYDGDDATWSRGPIGNSSDSGVASSASLPTVNSTGEGVHNDHDDYVGHLEQEIDDIYAMIRYGDRHDRSRSLDGKYSRQSLDLLSAGDVFSQTPMIGVYRGRRQSADAICTSQMPPAVALVSVERRESGKVVNMAQLSSPDITATRQSSFTQGSEDVQLVGISFRQEDEADNTENDMYWVDRNLQKVTTVSGRPAEAHAVVKGHQPRCYHTNAVCDCDEQILPTLNVEDPRRSRSKSLPEVNETRRDGKAHKSVIGTLTRSIANMFRRMRSHHKASRTLTVDTGFNTAPSERYSRKTE